MNIFKRICLFVFSLAGLLALAALCLPWVGPWTQEATALIGVDSYLMAVEVCVAILGVGLLITLLRSIFQRNRKVVEVSSADGDRITVTRDAIASQAIHVVEADGTLRARRVRVRAKKRGHVRVYVRVQPEEPVDVVACGHALHERLMEGLSKVCGDTIEAVTLEFVGAGQEAPREQVAPEAEAATEPVEASAAPAEAEDQSAHEENQEAPESSEITVSMGHLIKPAEPDDTDDGDEE